LDPDHRPTAPTSHQPPARRCLAEQAEGAPGVEQQPAGATPRDEVLGDRLTERVHGQSLPELIEQHNDHGPPARAIAFGLGWGWRHLGDGCHQGIAGFMISTRRSLRKGTPARPRHKQRQLPGAGVVRGCSDQQDRPGLVTPAAGQTTDQQVLAIARERITSRPTGPPQQAQQIALPSWRARRPVQASPLERKASQIAKPGFQGR